MRHAGRLAALLALLIAPSMASPGIADPTGAPSGALRPDSLEGLRVPHWLPADVRVARQPVATEPAAAAAPSAAPTAAEPAAAASEVTAGMTLAELEGIALANNPTLVQAAMRVRAAQGKYLQAGLYPNPAIGYRGEEIGNEGAAGQQGAFVRQEFVLAGKLPLSRAVAGHAVRQAEYAWQAQRQRVLSDVHIARYEVLAAQRTVELNRQLVHIGQQGVSAAQELLRALEVSRVDELQARIEADSANLRLREAENRYQAVWRQLAAVLGVPAMEPTHLAGSLEGDLPKLTWEDALVRLLAESPELAEARAAVERARCVLARECVERVPNVELQAGVAHDNSTRDNITSVEVTLPLPLWNRNQGNICRAQAQLATAENEVRRIELELQDRLAAAFQRYANARQEVEQYTATILPNAKTSLELVQMGYRQGEFGYLALLTAQRTYFQANLTYLESLRQLQTSAVQIEGLLLTGGLRGASGASGSTAEER